MTHLSMPHLWRLLALVVAATLWLAPIPPASAQEDLASEAQVAQARAAVEKLLASLRETATDEDLSVGQRRRLLADDLIASLDYETLASRALGPLAKDFSQQERTDFAIAYSRHASINFIRRVELGAKDATTVTGARALPKGAVEVTLKGPERAIGAPLAPTRTRGPVSSQLVLRPVGGRYRISIMRVGGVDPSEVFRAQAESVLAGGTPQDLINDLEERSRKFVESTRSASE